MHLAGDRDKATSERGSRPARAGVRGSGPLVVVIEDEPTQRSLLTRVLEQHGYEVIGLGDGESGLQAIVQHAPDLVLLDLNLPRMDGYEICRRLRADPLSATLPVIVITAHTALDDMVAALDAGADDFLAKP
ncbi:MAG: response regulator transcription factor, partial [Candidatus Limnocylindrales bacterium]